MGASLAAGRGKRRLGGMNELRGRPGRSQGGGDLVGNMPAFADAGDDQPPGRGGGEVERRAKGAVKRAREKLKPVDLGADNPARHGKVMGEASLLPMTFCRRR